MSPIKDRMQISWWQADRAWWQEINKVVMTVLVVHGVGTYDISFSSP
jgi:hypothetical protein